MEKLRVRGTDSAKVIQVIETTALRGSGTEGNPNRIVTQYWDFGGTLLAENDVENRKVVGTSSEERMFSEGEMKAELVRGFCTQFCSPNNTNEAPHPINTSILHIYPTLEEAKAFSQARVQGLLGHEELLKKIEATPIPLRKDGMPDLNNWKGFIEQLGSISLRELILAAKSSRVNFEKMFYLDKAIEYEKYVIATKIVKQFAEEGLSIKDSNEILESIQDMLLNSKVSC